MIGKFLDSEIDIGIIGDVWQWFQEKVGLLAADRSTLTLGGLVSLAIAIPTTVFFKLIFGNDAQPFPGGVLPSGDATAAATTGNRGGDACVLVGMFAAIIANIVQGITDMYISRKCCRRSSTTTRMCLSCRISRSDSDLRRLSWQLQPTPLMAERVAVPLSAPDFSTAGGWATFFNWIANWVPPAFDLVFSVLSVVLHKEGKIGRVMQFVDPLGVFVDAAIAVGTLITGIVESAVAEENALQWSANIFQPLATISMPLRISSRHSSSPCCRISGGS